MSAVTSGGGTGEAPRGADFSRLCFLLLSCNREAPEHPLCQPSGKRRESACPVDHLESLQKLGGRQGAAGVEARVALSANWPCAAARWLFPGSDAGRERLRATGAAQSHSRNVGEGQQGPGTGKAGAEGSLPLCSALAGPSSWAWRPRRGNLALSGLPTPAREDPDWGSSQAASHTDGASRLSRRVRAHRGASGSETRPLRA